MKVRSVFDLPDGYEWLVAIAIGAIFLAVVSVVFYYGG